VKDASVLSIWGGSEERQVDDGAGDFLVVYIHIREEKRTKFQYLYTEAFAS
jgi:hypothetical protein